MRARATKSPARSGLAFPACALAVHETIERALKLGVAFAGVTNSHHFGAAGLHLEAVADAGMVGLAFSNSPSAMPAWGGKRALFGTNPIAAAFPRRDGPALLIDLSLSAGARGKLMVAARDGKAIPEGWALDDQGHPTTDPKDGLAGSMLPAGGVKGAMLALVVELLVCALTGAQFGFEADSFFTDEGNRPRIGQAFLVIDPGALAGQDVFLDRVETLIAAMLEDDNVRLPGARRGDLARQAQAQGIEVPDALLRQIRQVIRMGRVTSITPGALHFGEQSHAVPQNTLFIDCTARAVPFTAAANSGPQFRGDTIVLQPVHVPLVTFSAALTAFLEVHYPDDATRNQIARTGALTDTPATFPYAFMMNLMNRGTWSQTPEIAAWLAKSRLDPTGPTVARMIAAGDPRLSALGGFRKAVMEAMPDVIRLGMAAKALHEAGLQTGARPTN